MKLFMTHLLTAIIFLSIGILMSNSFKTIILVNKPISTKQLAENGNAEAQYRLGVMYRDGIEVPPDDDMSFSWITKAAEQGYAEAQYHLGTMYAMSRYLNNEEIPPDKEMAIEWYIKAAEQGYVEAQINLAMIYESECDGLDPEGKKTVY